MDAIACGVDFDDVYRDKGFSVGMRPLQTAAGQLRISWLGQERIVNVVTDLDSSHRTVQAGEPVALIGTQLIEPATLTINFKKKSCAIRGD